MLYVFVDLMLDTEHSEDMTSVENEVGENVVQDVGWSGRVRQCVRSFIRLLWLSRSELGVPLAVFLSGVLLQRLAALFPEFTERFYARSIYPPLLVALSWFSRHFRFSVGELLTYLLLTAAFVCVVRLCVWLYLRPGERARRIVASARFGLWFAAVFLWAFLLSFGLNYQRPLLFNLLEYERRSASASELEAMSSEVLRGVNQSYEEAHAGGRPMPEREGMVGLLRESYDAVPELTLLPRGEYALPKPVLSSEVMSRLGVSGVYSPFTGEPNYNSDMPDFQLPFTMAHEMAHQRGVARESEANFVAYLVCINSRDPFIRYSGYRNGLGVLGEFYRLDPEKAGALIKQLSPGYREDSRRAAIFWAKAAGAAGSLSRRVNDLYLRANRVSAGAADYSGSTALIIGYYLKGMVRN
jgi:hypothetical protein